MNKTLIISIAVWSGFLTLICGDGLYAGTTAPDVIKMENPAYEKHKYFSRKNRGISCSIKSADALKIREQRHAKDCN
jgi:hypothetical protein